MVAMFYEASAFQSDLLSQWNVSSVTMQVNYT
jgi:surface protein